MNSGGAIAFIVTQFANASRRRVYTELAEVEHSKGKRTTSDWFYIICAIYGGIVIGGIIIFVAYVAIGIILYNFGVRIPLFGG